VRPLGLEASSSDSGRPGRRGRSNEDEDFKESEVAEEEDDDEEGRSETSSKEENQEPRQKFLTDSTNAGAYGFTNGAGTTREERARRRGQPMEVDAEDMGSSEDRHAAQRDSRARRAARRNAALVSSSYENSVQGRQTRGIRRGRQLRMADSLDSFIDDSGDDDEQKRLLRTQMGRAYRGAAPGASDDSLHSEQEDSVSDYSQVMYTKKQHLGKPTSLARQIA